MLRKRRLAVKMSPVAKCHNRTRAVQYAGTLIRSPTHDLEESAVSRKKNTEKRHKHRSIYPCPIILYRSLAPRTRRSRATYCPTDERHCQSFLDQDCSDIPSLRFQRSAVPPVIARRCSLCSGRAGTGDIYEIEVARLHNVPEPPCCFGS